MGGWGQVAGPCPGKMGSTGVREQGGTQTTPSPALVGWQPQLHVPSQGRGGASQGRDQSSPTTLQGRAEF